MPRQRPSFSATEVAPVAPVSEPATAAYTGECGFATEVEGVLWAYVSMASVSWNQTMRPVGTPTAPYPSLARMRPAYCVDRAVALTRSGNLHYLLRLRRHEPLRLQNRPPQAAPVRAGRQVKLIPACWVDETRGSSVSQNQIARPVATAAAL